MADRVEFLGFFYEEIKEDEKCFLEQLEELTKDRQDSTIKKIMEDYFKSKDIDISKLTFHEGANHIEWKKNGEDYFVIERHWVPD